MASAARQFEFLVIVPDHPGVQAKRLEVRPSHFANLEPLQEAGKVAMGGAILHEVPEDDEVSSLKFAGSSFVFKAGSKQEVLDILTKDPYVEAGVWDISKAQIWPLKAAFRNAL